MVKNRSLYFCAKFFFEWCILLLVRSIGDIDGFRVEMKDNLIIRSTMNLTILSKGYIEFYK